MVKPFSGAFALSKQPDADMPVDLRKQITEGIGADVPTLGQMLGAWGARGDSYWALGEPRDGRHSDLSCFSSSGIPCCDFGSLMWTSAKAVCSRFPYFLRGCSMTSARLLCAMTPVGPICPICDDPMCPLLVVRRARTVAHWWPEIRPPRHLREKRSVEGIASDDTRMHRTGRLGTSRTSFVATRGAEQTTSRPYQSRDGQASGKTPQHAASGWPRTAPCAADRAVQVSDRGPCVVGTSCASRARAPRSRA